MKHSARRLFIAAAIVAGCSVVGALGTAALGQATAYPTSLGKQECDVVGIQEILQKGGNIRSTVNLRCPKVEMPVVVADQNVRKFKAGQKAVCDLTSSIDGVFGHERPADRRWTNCEPVES